VVSLSFCMFLAFIPVIFFTPSPKHPFWCKTLCFVSLQTCDWNQIQISNSPSLQSHLILFQNSVSFLLSSALSHPLIAKERFQISSPSIISWFDFRIVFVFWMCNFLFMISN
jgi:hypothetical protein